MASFGNKRRVRDSESQRFKSSSKSGWSPSSNFDQTPKIFCRECSLSIPQIQEKIAHCANLKKVAWSIDGWVCGCTQLDDRPERNVNESKTFGSPMYIFPLWAAVRIHFNQWTTLTKSNFWSEIRSNYLREPFSMRS